MLPVHVQDMCRRVLPGGASFLRTIAALLLGCCLTDRSVAQAPSGTQDKTDKASVATDVDAGSDTWDAHFIQDQKVGYGHSWTSDLEVDGRTLKQTNAIFHLAVKRLGEKVSMSLKMQSIETAEGEVRSFRSEVALGPTPTITEGRVDGNSMNLTISTRGKTSKMKIPWSPEFRGFFVTEQSLERKPMKPGQRRSFQALVPMFNQVAKVELVAEEEEETAMLEGTQRLLKITSTTRLGVAELKSVLWTDPHGRVLKSFEPTMGQQSYRTTQQVALSDLDQLGPDVIIDTVIKLKGDPGDVRRVHQARYVVSVKDDDPLRLIPASAAQSIESAGDHQAELIVRRVQVGKTRLEASEKEQPPTDKDRQPNNWIQSDDRRVVALAREVLPDDKDPTRIAVALEAHVNRLIDEKNFSTALATAAEVAESREGDCTEHAVLLAALARSRGIPARVVMGLVYVESLGGFGYHMWNEVWLNGTWTPLDATLARRGTGVGHIKIAHSNFSNTDGAGALLPVLQVMGRLKIRLVDTQAEGD